MDVGVLMKRISCALCLALLLASNAYAAPKYKKVLTEGKDLAKRQTRFAKSVKSLSTARQEKLRKALAKVGEDSDGDGDSDIWEDAHGSNICTPDRNGDGAPDGEDLEIKGLITSYVAPTLVIGAKSFTVSGSTIFKGRHGAAFSEADLQSGVCVEVKGHTEGTGDIADLIKSDDGCNGEGEDD